MLCMRGNSQRLLDAQRPDQDADVHDMHSVILRLAGESCQCPRPRCPSSSKSSSPHPARSRLFSTMDFVEAEDVAQAPAHLAKGARSRSQQD
eukprot:15233157-Heterocapsa_arctica.AAC.1